MDKPVKARSSSNEPNALLVKMAEKFAIDSNQLLDVLKQTAFKQANKGPEVTDAQMYALLIVADQYNLNPFTKEIYAFPDKRGGIVPVVGVDGWTRIANEHSFFDGVEFAYSPELIPANHAKSPCPAWIEAKVYRKDRSHPIVVREYLDECYREPYKDTQTGYVSIGAWQTHPKRLLRHKALIQCYRVAFGFVGIYDEDEAERIIDAHNGDKRPPANVVALPTSGGAQTIEHDNAQTVSEFIIDFDQTSVDDFVERLSRRAQKSGCWNAAQELLSERLNGNALIYANEKLHKLIDSGDTKEAAIPVQEPQSNRVNEEPDEQFMEMFKVQQKTEQGSMF